MSGYNQTLKGQHVRVGNWFEELKLKEDTGIRYYPDPTNRGTSLLTKSRVIEHTDRVNPKDYTTVTRSTLVDPRVITANEKKPDPYGPRRKQFENSIKKSIEDEIERKNAADFTESRRLTYMTATKETFTKPNFMSSLKENDISVRLPTKNANYTTDNAVTLYSHAIADPRLKVNFPTTFVGSTNPFRKNCYFSADIQSTMYATRTEAEERPNPLPTVEQFKTLSLLVASVLDLARRELQRSRGIYPPPGAATRYVLQAIYSKGQETLNLQELESSFASYFPDFSLRESEKRALLAAFDARSDGSIVVQDFVLFIKRTPVARRLELIEFFFLSLEPDNKSGVVNLAELKRKVTDARLSPKHYVHDFLSYITEGNPFEEFSMNDFFDYHIDASIEIENDDNFEEFMKESWAFLN